MPRKNVLIEKTGKKDDANTVSLIVPGLVAKTTGWNYPPADASNLIFDDLPDNGSSEFGRQSRLRNRLLALHVAIK